MVASIDLGDLIRTRVCIDVGDGGVEDILNNP